MPSPRRAAEGRPLGAALAGGGGGGGGVPGSPARGGGRFEFQALLGGRVPGGDPGCARPRPAESPARRRRGSFPAASPGPGPAPAPAAPAPAGDRRAPHPRPSCLDIALRALLAVDLGLSKRLGVCAAEGSAWGSARPLMKLLEVSGHGVPWLLGTGYCLARSRSSAGREVLTNLLFALLLDLLLVGLLKALVRRRRPAHNQMDMFLAVSVDKFSFPSGHATRAALVARFVLNHLVLAVPLRVLVVLWALVLGLSRVMLGRHNVSDVAFGFLLGYMTYSIVDHCWLSPQNAAVLFAFWSQE